MLFRKTSTEAQHFCTTERNSKVLRHPSGRLSTLLLIVGALLSTLQALDARAQGACDGDPSELVLTNGMFLTMDASDSIVSAVRIVDGRFVAVGDVGSTAGVCVIDLGGRTVTPGLIDTHIHYLRDSHIPGHHFSAIETTFTISDLLTALTERAATVPTGEFITVFGRFVASQFVENRLPSLAELDSAAPNHPVYLHSGFSGPAATNTMGKTFFEASGISVNSSGAINRGQTDPFAQALFATFTNEEAQRTVREYMEFFASLGLTTVQNFSGCGGSFGANLPAGVLCDEHFYDVWQQDLLSVRLRTAAGGTGTSTDQNGNYLVVQSAESAMQDLADLGGGDEMLKFTTTGEFVVGRFGDTTAPFTAAYGQIADRGWSLRQHSISNGENNAHISAFEAVNASTPIADLRWALEHVFSISNNDIARLSAVGAGVTVQNQQYLLGSSGPPYRSLVDSGIPIGGGTDASAISPLSPWISLYHMVSGRTASGSLANAGQQISRMEALHLYTTGSAWYTFDDEDLGSIEVGKLADLVVVSADYLSVREEDIRTLSSVLTLIGGKIVHAGAEFASLATALDDQFELPGSARLFESYPNPFSTATTIEFSLSNAGTIRLRLFNTLGQLIETLAQGPYSAGTHLVTVSGADLPGGVYLYQLETSSGLQTGTLLHIR